MTPAIATPVEEIIRASRRVITGSGCEIAATKLCLWPHDQPEPSRLLLPRLLLIPPFSFLCCVCKFSDHLSPNTTAKNRPNEFSKKYSTRTGELEEKVYTWILAVTFSHSCSNKILYSLILLCLFN